MARAIGKTWTRKSPRLKQKRSDGLVMEELTEIEALSSVIQLAVAPVLLLAGIAGLLHVLSVRLDRAVDRVRVVETRLGKEPHSNHVTILQAGITAVWSRIRLANWSIRMLVAAALVIFLLSFRCSLVNLRVSICRR